MNKKLLLSRRCLLIDNKMCKCTMAGVQSLYMVPICILQVVCAAFCCFHYVSDQQHVNIINLDIEKCVDLSILGFIMSVKICPYRNLCKVFTHGLKNFSL